ncbi:MAG: radical SAM protein [Candidatus Lindowbacteria bacterium]|nr:radical SAM protein [Candidatus Lindowbacteria bacterium]
MTSSLKCELPSNITLHLTENCNLRCKMCYFWGETGQYVNAAAGSKPKMLDVGLVRRIVQELAPARPAYSLFGGEPLIYPHIEETIVAIKEAGSVVDTPTNGTLLAKHAAMLVKTGFDFIRVSIDGPREINDSQRGRGSYDKALASIEALHLEKSKTGAAAPNISIIYTVTPENHLSVEKFFLRDLDLSMLGFGVTIQMQNFVTEAMGKAYARMLESELGITSNRYWRGLVRSPEDFATMELRELSRQVSVVCKRFEELGKGVLLLPPTFSFENLAAYTQARWAQMTDSYRTCMMPWQGADIMANGDLAPCHIFYDLVVGNLYDHSFEELWNGERYRLLRSYMERHGLMTICPGCCVLYLAGAA